MKNKKRILIIYLVIAIITTFLAIINGQFFNKKFTIEIGEISPMTLHAPFTIENEVATQRKIALAKETVEPVYMRDETIEEQAILRVNELFSNTIAVKNVYSKLEDEPTLPISLKEQYNIVDEVKADPVKTLQSVSPIALYREEYEVLLEATIEELEQLEQDIIVILQGFYSEGIKDPQDKTVLIREQVEATNINVSYTKVAHEIIASQIYTNIVIDEEGTSKKIDEVVNEVEPIFILENEKIVDEGTRVTEEIYVLLDKAGYLDNSERTAYTQYIGVILLIVLAAILGVDAFNAVKDDADVGKDDVDSKLYRHLSLFFILYLTTLSIIGIFQGGSFVYLPIAIGPMLIAILSKKQVAVIFNIMVVVIAALIRKSEMIEIIYFLITGLTSIAVITGMQQRKQMMRSAAIVGLINAGVYLGLRLITGVPFSVDILVSMGECFIVAVITVILVIGSLPLWEAWFGFITSYQLLEFTNPNQPILKRMLLEATGTYYHSLLVANLAETAADEIGANPLLARVGGYYHDIGKLSNINYFKENQVLENPHDHLTPRASASIILSHVTTGLEIAQEYKLPQCIKDMIVQHHGTSTMQYFYIKAREIEGEDVAVEDFTYPGPKPMTKEAGIVMLADVVEATVRSMQHKIGKEIQIEDLVRKMVKQKIEEGELDECPLYMSDIEKIIESFCRMLKGMYHERIEYPDKKGKKK